MNPNTPRSPARTIPIMSTREVRTTCASCSLQELCLPVGLSDPEIEKLGEIISLRQHVRRGAYLYRIGDPFRNLFAVRTGAFKTLDVSEDGGEKITGFYLAGEILGMDAISTDRQNFGAVALEDSEVCVVPFTQLEHLLREIPTLQHHFHKLMSRDIMRDQGLMLLLAGMRAEARLAAFLIGLSQRFAQRGYSSTRFRLRMTREEIGSYLGLTLETVSRLFSRFAADGLIRVDRREVEVIDLKALRAVVDHRE
ncbi:MAG: fumarate/nitrate reduction transcriptional regulator Fnr [Pseudomonadota bacterium]